MSSDPMTKQEIIAKQMKEADDTGRPFIRCGCLRKLWMPEAYKCLYCEQWYCKKCAEGHFGKTVDEYQKEKAGALVSVVETIDCADGGAEGEIFAEGVFAAQRGDELEADNPYDCGDDEYGDWRDGWEYGAEAL